MTKRQAKKWACALRSGKYKQTTRCLEDENGYCCLGVAVKIFSNNPELNEHGYLKGATLFSHPRVYDSLGIGNVGSLIYAAELEDKVHLASLNDQFELTFDEIADIIELKWIHGAL